MTLHSFHIPVMGIGFTIDTPLKVAHMGIDSTLSLVDDILIEKLRKMYCEKFKIPYCEITEDIHDFRAKRITSYLNLIHNLAQKKIDQLKVITSGFNNELKKYFELLPDTSVVKHQFNALISNNHKLDSIKEFLEANLSMGCIDVNIMTKVDKENYQKGELLPTQYNDAHAALRGFANSNLTSSVILSAGMNPRLYSYLEKFDDFYPDADNVLKKKIVLKVSDYRSAVIQGKFLAKKGLWVSEYRIESGLNCGGHAFATDGYLMGPILAQFRDCKEVMVEEIHNILIDALSYKKRYVPSSALPIKISAQGGVGTSEEHEFLLEHYKVDSVGWGTPFLLVPEATTVDNSTLEKLVNATENDVYLSDISPLGIPFNSLKGNTKDDEKMAYIQKNRPGSPCPKKYVALNKEFTKEGICTASRQYQHLKIQELVKKELPPKEYKKAYNKIIDKTCACVGLGTTALLKYGLDTKTEGNGVSICPGPNIAYFSKITSLKEMLKHIYGETNVITRKDRPNMLIKELIIYIDFLGNKIEEAKDYITDKQLKYLSTFSNNLREGILYYQQLFDSLEITFKATKAKISRDLEGCVYALNHLDAEIYNLKAVAR